MADPLTEAERALVEFTLLGGSVSNYSERLSELRGHVLRERVPEWKRVRWIAGYKAYKLAQQRWYAELATLELPEGLTVVEWRDEAKRQLQEEDAPHPTIFPMPKGCQGNG